jgi:hypothetical protein
MGDHHTNKELKMYAGCSKKEGKKDKGNRRTPGIPFFNATTALGESTSDQLRTRFVSHAASLYPTTPSPTTFDVLFFFF